MAGTLQFRDPETFAPIGAPVSSNDTQLFQLTFSPDGRLVAASDIGGQTQLVDVEARRPLATALPMALGDYVSFSPDGNKMAASWSDTTLVWDLDPALWHEPGCEIAGPQPHGGGAARVAPPKIRRPRRPANASPGDPSASVDTSVGRREADRAK
jgi:hypothetical protein